MSVPLGGQAPCPLCIGPAEESGSPNNARQFICERCGVFYVGEEVVQAVMKRSGRLVDPPLAAILSGIARELHEDNLPRLRIMSDDFGLLIARYSPPRTPMQKMDRLVSYVGDRKPVEGEGILFVYERDFPICYCTDAKSLIWLIQKAEDLKWIERTGGSTKQCNISLDLKGWERCEQIHTAQVKSPHAFVAMSFDPKWDKLYDHGFYPALKQCGWEPYRADKDRENDYIDNKLIANIRRSGLVIADFTDCNAGAYFEAGFGQGLSKNVVFTIKSDQIDTLHFDTSHFTHVKWDDENHLRTELIEHLEANNLIGPGPRGESSTTPTD